MIAALRRGDPQTAAAVMRDEHWSFEKHETYIRQFYFNATREIEAELDQRRSGESG
jgi:hypothetical protein